LTLLGLELRPLGLPARSQSLYRQCYPGPSTVAYLRSCCIAMAVYSLLVSRSLPSKKSICHNIFHSWVVTNLKYNLIPNTILKMVMYLETNMERKSSRALKRNAKSKISFFLRSLHVSPNCNYVTKNNLCRSSAVCTL
jgi:hypothetical protein